MLNKESKNDITKAKLALSLSASTATGKAPSLLELDLMATGEISTQREQQILSHIASDQATFDQWWTLVKTQTWLDDQSIEVFANEPVTNERRGWSSWLQGLTLPVFAGSIAAVLGLYFAVPMVQTGFTNQALNKQYEIYQSGGYSPSAPWDHNDFTKSIPLQSNNTAQRSALLIGIQAGLSSLKPLNTSWDSWIVKAPSIEIKAHNAEGLEQLGQWALLTHLFCTNKTIRNTETNARYNSIIKDQKSLLERIDRNHNVRSSTVLESTLEGLTTTDSCEVAHRTLSVAVPPAQR